MECLFAVARKKNTHDAYYKVNNILIDRKSLHPAEKQYPKKGQNTRVHQERVVIPQRAVPLQNSIFPRVFCLLMLLLRFRLCTERYSRHAQRLRSNRQTMYRRSLYHRDDRKSERSESTRGVVVPSRLLCKCSGLY